MELLAAALGIACVWCNARERIEGWPLAIASAALYLAVFWEARLYALHGAPAGVHRLLRLRVVPVAPWWADHGPLVITRTEAGSGSPS